MFFHLLCSYYPLPDSHNKSLEQLMNIVHTLIAATGVALATSTSWSLAQDTLPKPIPPFTGHADIDVRKSIPSWPKSVAAQKGAPNIVLILIDDAGFGVTSTFGGPVSTPNYDRLAADGLRYNEFHVNSICSPTRSALLSGRNSHEMGFGNTEEQASGYPGYNTIWPKSSASIAEVLKDNGYSTAAFGKWHNTPEWEVSPAGPFDRWPTGLGFEYYYGFMSGADNQYYPRIYRDTTPVEPSTTPEQGYHFTTDITNDAIRWLHQHDAVADDKPFFLYFATGATHTPHQVPKEWVDKYKGQFDAGWDKLREEAFNRQIKLGVIPANTKLTPRPRGLPAWDSLSPDEKVLVAHQAEVYAGYAAQTDYEVGRLLDAIKEEDKSDNTVVLWIYGDNGGSAQGGPLGTDAHAIDGAPKSLEERLSTEDALGSELYMNHYAAAWAWAQSVPFQGTKTDASHLGGTRDPLIISWPARIKQVGGLRSQFSHVNDIAPTLYEVAGITPPKYVNGVQQTPLEGTSLVYTFDHPSEPSHHHVQYFASRGNRAIYKDGWWAGDLVNYTWEPNGEIPGYESQNPNYNIHPWELYHLTDDYSQADDLASKYPAKLKELQLLFDEEAKRNHVYPLLATTGAIPTPQRLGKSTFIYRDGVDRLQGLIAPRITGRAYTLTADIEIPERGAEGVIFAQGGKYGGTTLFVKNNRIIYEINAFGNLSGQIISSEPLSPGKAHVVIGLVPDSVGTIQSSKRVAAKGLLAGTATLLINNKPEGTGRFKNINGDSSGETLDIGSDLGSPVSTEYKSPNRFTGKIETVAIQLQ
jgi:arylsulfatase